MSNIRIVAEIKIKPEFREGMMPALQTLVAGSRAEKGNIMYDLTESLDTPGQFFMIEDWVSAQAIEEHNATAHFKNFGVAIQGKAEKLVVVKLKNVI